MLPRRISNFQTLRKQFTLFLGNFGPLITWEPFFIRDDAAKRVSGQYFTEQSKDSFFRNSKLVRGITTAILKRCHSLLFLVPRRMGQREMKPVCTL